MQPQPTIATIVSAKASNTENHMLLEHHEGNTFISKTCRNSMQPYIHTAFNDQRLVRDIMACSRQHICMMTVL